VWFCPGPNSGPAVVHVNFRRRNSLTWEKLTYSLKESTTRVNIGGKGKPSDVGGDPMSAFKFDQEERHTAFWNYVRENKWEVVAGYIDAKVSIVMITLARQRNIVIFCATVFQAVLYSADDLILRRWRILEYLRNLFENLKSFVASTVFVFAPGHTKSTLMVYVSQICLSGCSFEYHRSIFPFDQAEEVFARIADNYSSGSSASYDSESDGSYSGSEYSSDDYSGSDSDGEGDEDGDKDKPGSTSGTDKGEDEQAGHMGGLEGA
jgi:hypothetical protein